MKFNKNVQVREEKFGTVIFETLKEKVFVTNPTGADIVRLLKEKKSVSEITKELAVKYGTTETTITADVNQFVDNMIKNDVICRESEKAI